MPGLSCVILSNVLSLLRERFLGSHWLSHVQQMVPTPGSPRVLRQGLGLASYLALIAFWSAQWPCLGAEKDGKYSPPGQPCASLQLCYYRGRGTTNGLCKRGLLNAA